MPTLRELRGADVIVTGGLLIAHAVLAFLCVLAVSAFVMGLDPCGYVQCGDERWAGVGVRIALIGALVLVPADVGVSMWRLTAGRHAWFVPLLFCLAQIGTAAIGLAFVSAAGPV